jgi:hypothetical protein
VRSHNHLALSLVLLLVVVCRVALAAPPLLTMTCADPQGTETSYGPGLLEIRDLTVDTRPMTLSGTHLTFVLEADQPQRLRVTWEPPPAARETATTLDAMVIATTDDQITAVPQRAEGVWMYSVFPKLGIGYVSAHNHVPFGSTSRSLALYARCYMTKPTP